MRILSYNNRKPNEKIKEIFIPNGPRLQSILNKTATKNKEKNTFPLPVCSQYLNVYNSEKVVAGFFIFSIQLPFLKRGRGYRSSNLDLVKSDFSTHVYTNVKGKSCRYFAGCPPSDSSQMFGLLF